MYRKPLVGPPGLTLLFMALFTVAFGGSIGMAEASSTPTPPYTVSVSPASVVAGSPGNTVTFRFSATSPADGLLSVAVPPVASGSAWTTPQFTNPAAAGFVKVAQQTCSSAWVSSISGDGGGPGTIFVKAKCNKGQQFALKYGAGTGSRVTAPTKAGPYTFTAKAVLKGVFLALAAQPVVTVNARRAVTLGVTGLANAVAGTPQTPTVTAKDRYGNTAVDYRGTVHFTGSGDPSFFSFNDPGWNLPADHTFTAGDAGTVTTHPIGSGIAAKTAGLQTLTATDSQTNAITGSQTITISPAATAFQTANFGSTSGSAIPGQTVRATINAVAGDYYGNIATGDNDFINVAVRDGSSEYTLGAFLENGKHDFNISVPVLSSQVQLHATAVDRPGVVGLSSILVMYGPPPRLDEVKLDWDPTTQNPDGTYNGHLDIKDPNSATVQQADPNSVVVSGDPIFISSNGTTSLPVTINIVGGGTISTTITVTTPTDPVTGAFTVANYSTGTELQILGCDSANETFASIDAGTAPTGLPPPPPCPNTTWSPVTVDQSTAYVRNPLDNTYLSPIVGVYVAP